MKRNWVFLIGPPNSARECIGNAIFNKHPDSSIFGHSDFPLAFYDYFSCIEKEKDCLYLSMRGYKNTEFPKKNSFSIEYVEKFGLNKLTDDFTPLDITRSICDSIWENMFNNNIVLGDASHTYCYRHQELRKIFPECLFIIADRDIDVNCREHQRVNKLEHLSLEEIKKWILPIKQACELIPNALTVNIKELKTDPIKWINIIFDYTGLSINKFDRIEESVAEITKWKHLDCGEYNG